MSFKEGALSNFNPETMKIRFIMVFLYITSLCVLLTEGTLNAIIETDPRFVFSSNNVSPGAKTLRDNLKINYIPRARTLTLRSGDITWRYRNRRYAYIDPVKLKVKAKDLQDLVTKIARPYRRKKMLSILRGENLISREENFYSVTITKKIVPLLKPGKLRERFSERTYDLYLDLSNLNSDNFEEFVSFYSPLIGHDELIRKIKILKKRRSTILNIRDLVFPRFARENYNSFSPLYGPNCFHATLAFNQYGVEFDRRVNYKIEKNLNFNFINNYEFFKALHRMYNRVRYRDENLNFGDIIVLFSKKISIDGSTYESFKHGSVYLGNGFVFTKGSKRAADPYRIDRFKTDYTNWQKKLGNIGIHVFRLKKNYLKK